MITLQERVHSVEPPSNWKMNKTHRVFRVRRGYKNIGMREQNLLSLSFGRIINKDIETAEGLLPENFETYQIVEPGNIILRLTDLQNDKRSLRQGLVKQRGIITSAYDALEVGKDHDPRYWTFVLLSLDSAKYYYSLGGGVRQSIGFSDFPNEWIATPDLATQKAIATFLDAETARIDALIEKKERLIKALAEKQASEVDRVILGSLDPAGRPKLDPIAREIWKLKTLCSRLGNGFVGPTRDILVDQDNGEAVPYLQSTHVKNSSIDFLRRPYFVQESWLKEKPKVRVQKDDLVIVQTGDCGATAIIDETFAGSGCHAMIIARPIAKRILPRLLLHILSSAYGRSQLAAIQTGALHPHLEVGFVKEIPIPLPPRDMQEAIVRKVDKQIEKISDIREKTSESINRLREFRGALITAAVTGQIDPAGSRRRAEVDRRLDAIERNFAWRG